MNATRGTAARSVASTLVQHESVRVGQRDTPILAVGVGDVRLVWLPALLDSAASFTRVALDLADRLHGSVKVCAVDPPGYGSAVLADGERIPTFAELGPWINAVLDLLPGPFILAGNSSGAVIAARAAGVRRDVLGFALVGWCDWRLIGQPHTDLLSPSTPADLQHLLKVGWHRAPRPFANVLAAQLSYSQREDYRAHVRSFSPEAFGRDFDRYTGPLALIGGTSDGIITPTMVRALATQRPQACLHLIEQCGHYPHREQPKQLGEILGQWIEALPGVVAHTEHRKSIAEVHAEEGAAPTEHPESIEETHAVHAALSERIADLSH
jgi:pimeloyl-ACP methyl ester carboxylesterase